MLQNLARHQTTFWPVVVQLTGEPYLLEGQQKYTQLGKRHCLGAIKWVKALLGYNSPEGGNFAQFCYPHLE